VGNKENLKKRRYGMGELMRLCLEGLIAFAIASILSAVKSFPGRRRKIKEQITE
tara:strand:+ start:126 stop:287 length:162 start_codon:yes stop_codon:yes gene_type:complete